MAAPARLLTPSYPAPPSWEIDARCRGADIALFYPDPHAKGVDPSAGEPYASVIAAYCHRCTVRAQCLARALAAEPPGDSPSGRSGIFGGLTAAQRARPELRALVLAGGMAPLPGAHP